MSQDKIKKDFKNADKYDGLALECEGLISRTDFLDVVGLAKDAGYKRIKIVSNGQILADPSHLEKLHSAGITLFEVSLVGFSQAAANGIAAIKSFEVRAKDKKDIFLAIRFKVTKENYEYISLMVHQVMPFRPDRIILSFEDNELSMTEITPHVKLTIQTSLLNQIWIVTERVPLCLLEGYEHHVSETVLTDSIKRSQGGDCPKCVYADSCQGIDKEYTKKHGFDEFKAVSKSPYAKDIKGLRR